ncbi:MAG TPA: hypothetical protein GXZ43_03790 [Clostridiaceae bacterium]|nr:hypothetical protein [Clostridiaceae bacterium]
MKRKKKRCTANTTGQIVNIRSKGLDCPTIITVQYQVDNQLYEVKESIKLRSEIIKLGFLPIGQRKIPVMGNTAVGNPARVSYNPDNPSDAYLTDNIGIMNC